MWKKVIYYRLNHHHISFHVVCDVSGFFHSFAFSLPLSFIKWWDLGQGRILGGGLVVKNFGKFLQVASVFWEKNPKSSLIFSSIRLWSWVYIEMCAFMKTQYISALSIRSTVIFKSFHFCRKVNDLWTLTIKKEGTDWVKSIKKN